MHIPVSIASADTLPCDHWINRVVDAQRNPSVTVQVGQTRPPRALEQPRGSMPNKGAESCQH
jgi:hypothetical protein